MSRLQNVLNAIAERIAISAPILKGVYHEQAPDNLPDADFPICVYKLRESVPRHFMGQGRDILAILHVGMYFPHADGPAAAVKVEQAVFDALDRHKYTVPDWANVQSFCLLRRERDNIKYYLNAIVDDYEIIGSEI